MNINTSFHSIEQMTSQLLAADKRKNNPANNNEHMDFNSVFSQKVLKERSEGLTFSKHANQRLVSRNIDLSKEQINRLNDGARKAQEKGIKESLVMVDDMAFIVNITNNTVVTALGESDSKVVTNIDGAVIA